jgi:RimJ/RimL family protein N-acetyltransferase
MSTCFPAHAPVLETSRLLLRGHRKDDHKPCAAMWGDPETTRYIGDRPFTGEESWGRLLRYVGHWEVMGFGYWAVEEKASGEFAGETGFADYRREMEPALGVPEVGWVLAPRFYGLGYATEAVRAILEWGDLTPDTQSTACIIHPDNTGSIRVAKKCGYRSTGKVFYKTGEVLIYKR